VQVQHSFFALLISRLVVFVKLKQHSIWVIYAECWQKMALQKNVLANYNKNNQSFFETANFPAIALLGPRQSGKTTLV
jgi:predicted AAA+ superfamily ATPase